MGALCFLDDACGWCTSASRGQVDANVVNRAVIVGVVWTSPADAAPMSGIGNPSIQVAAAERVGYRRYYRRHGYPVPYAYYPPPYGYYVPPPAYAYPRRTSITLGFLLRKANMRSTGRRLRRGSAGR